MVANVLRVVARQGRAMIQVLAQRRELKDEIPYAAIVKGKDDLLHRSCLPMRTYADRSRRALPLPHAQPLRLGPLPVVGLDLLGPDAGVDRAGQVLALGQAHFSEHVALAD